MNLIQGDFDQNRASNEIDTLILPTDENGNIIPPQNVAEWSLAQMQTALKRKLPDKILGTLKDKGNAKFLSWYNAAKILDKYSPGWEWQLENTYFTDDRIFVVGKLILHASDGDYSRSAIGSEMLKRTTIDKNTHQSIEKELAYGDPSSNASASAFKRAAAMFGLALYLYGNK